MLKDVQSDAIEDSFAAGSCLFVNPPLSRRGIEISGRRATLLWRKSMPQARFIREDRAPSDGLGEATSMAYYGATVGSTFRV